MEFTEEIEKEEAAGLAAQFDNIYNITDKHEKMIVDMKAGMFRLLGEYQEMHQIMQAVRVENDKLKVRITYCESAISRGGLE